MAHVYLDIGRVALDLVNRGSADLQLALFASHRKTYEHNIALAPREAEKQRDKDADRDLVFDVVVFVVGDFAHKADNDRAAKMFVKLRGTKHLDGEFVRTQLAWASVMDRMKITVDGQKIVFDHYPVRSWEGVWSAAIQLYGHVHNRIDVWPNSVDVGVDAWGYRPVALMDIRARLDAALPHTIEEFLLDGGDVPEEEELEVSGLKI